MTLARPQALSRGYEVGFAPPDLGVFYGSNPFGPNEPPTEFVMSVLPAEAYWRSARPAK
jgi:hypothetical protein